MTTGTLEQTLTTPEAGTWVFDNDHSSIEAVARHLMVSKVRGRFEEFEGTVEVGDSLEDSRVEVTIAADSINTNTPDRDEHLRSGDFLDVENHPELRFESTEVRRTGDEELRVRGDLTIRGETNEVELDVTYLGLHEDPWGNEKAAFAAQTTLNREDWGMTWNQALETGGVLVGKELKVEINVQLQRSES
ncbi:MAG: YceI family protein [Nitriliruptorales bacterium]|nr:YceI family protein [Nitriliruptorales bacterium]